MPITYPLPRFHFRVEWGGASIGFSEVTGLNVERAVIEYRDGSSPEFHKIKFAGMENFPNITLKRGTFAGDAEFFTWWNSVAMNAINRRDLTISLLNDEHNPVVVWKIKQAWPIKVMSGDLKSDASEVLIESIELVHEGLSIQHP